MKLTPADNTQIFSHSVGKKYGAGGYCQTSNSFTINGALRDVAGGGKNAIVGSLKGNPNVSVGRDLYNKKLQPDDIKTIETLDKAIADNSLPYPVMVIRNVDANAIASMIGTKTTIIGQNPVNIINHLQTMTSGLVPDPGFMSVSTNATNNVFTDRRFQLEIEVPAHTPMLVTKNLTESECVLGRSTKLQLISARTVKYPRKTGYFGVIRVRVIP